jgi:hypothetical protein
MEADVMENDVMKHARMWRAAEFLASVALVLQCLRLLRWGVADSIRAWPWHGLDMLAWPMCGIGTAIFMLLALASIGNEISDVAIRIVFWILSRWDQR